MTHHSMFYKLGKLHNMTYNDHNFGMTGILGLRLWNTNLPRFPMYSEGCGLGEPLWAGEYAINQTGLFVRHIHQTGRLPYKLKLEVGMGEGGLLEIVRLFFSVLASKVECDMTLTYIIMTMCVKETLWTLV